MAEMDKQNIIVVKGLKKSFKLPHEKHTSVKSLFINIFRKRRYEKQTVLHDISFEIKKGEFFGIIGRNGSGKSTLMKLLASIYVPDKGDIEVRGSLTPFIELGVGFNPELTGRENVYLNGALLGFNRKQIQAMYHDIVAFAELKKFMDQKLKNYSSGMQVRLAFSIAIRAKSDILLIDEVLAVGDAAFQQKCYEYFRRLKGEQRTVIFVSHDRGAIESFCDRCVLINDGEIVAEGEPTKVLNEYNEITLDQISSSPEPAETKGAEAAEPKEDLRPKTRWGNGDIQIIKASLTKGKNTFAPDDMIELEVEMKVRKNIRKPVYGVVIKGDDGHIVLITNTKIKKINTGQVKANSKVSITYNIKNIFGNGRYSISPAVASEDTKVFYDWREGLLQFFVAGWEDTFTPIHPPHDIVIQKK